MFKTLVVTALTCFALSAYAIEKQVVSGNCKALLQQIKKGVTDAGGPHPDRPGNTHVTLEPKLSHYKYLLKEGQKKGEICAFTSLKIELKVKNASTRLDWQPSADTPKNCAAQRQAWAKTIEAHEAGHVKDNQRLESAYNQKIKAQVFVACGANEGAAVEELKQKIRTAADAALTQLTKQINDAEIAYHREHGASVDPPACCMSEQPTGAKTYCPCKGRERNFDSETQCAERCSSGLACFATQCTTAP